MVKKIPNFKNELKDNYDQLKSTYEELCDEVLYTLRKALQGTNIKIHSISQRETKIKTFESFYNKIIRKELIENHFNSVEDIAAVRVICLYRADLQNIERLIHQNFEVLKSDTSRTRTETPFGYSSDHYIVSFGKNCKGARYDAIQDLKCEVQVRTILMDAWATVSHHLDYKQEIDIPKDLRTDFNALAGLFYVADTHFEFFKNGIQETREILTETVVKGDFDLTQELNLDSSLAYLQIKFPDRQITSVESDIITELRNFGYVQISDLEPNVKLAMPILKEIEMKIFGLTKWEPKWSASGVIRMILDLTDKDYSRRLERMKRRLMTKPQTVKYADMIRQRIALVTEYSKKLGN